MGKDDHGRGTERREKGNYHHQHDGKHGRGGDERHDKTDRQDRDDKRERLKEREKRDEKRGRRGDDDDDDDDGGDHGDNRHWRRNHGRDRDHNSSPKDEYLHSGDSSRRDRDRNYSRMDDGEARRDGSHHRNGSPQLAPTTTTTRPTSPLPTTTTTTTTTMDDGDNNNDDDNNDDDDFGPALPAHLMNRDNNALPNPNNIKAHHGQNLLPGEGAAIAAFVEKGERIPRRGEVGLEPHQITQFENAGFVMSGSRHATMDAIRRRKESQIIGAEQAKVNELIRLQEKSKKQEAFLESMSEIATKALQNQLRKG